MQKLNLGCGSIQPEGWVNIDLDPIFSTNYKDVSEFDDNTFDVIVAHCIMQIPDYNEYVNLLKGIRRILKPEGIFRVSLPNIERGFKALQDGDIEWFPNGEDNIDDRFSNWLTWYSTSNSLLTPKAFMNRLKDADFSKSFQVEYKKTILDNYRVSTELDDREGECYFIEATR